VLIGAFISPASAGLSTGIDGEIKACMGRVEIMSALRLQDEKPFREHYEQAGIARG